MRLIDADKLSFRCNYEGDCSADISHCQEWCSNYVVDYDDIKDQPTAYDVDKVIEKLNNIKKYNLNLADMMLDIQSNGTNRHFICLEDAIEIVKQGIRKDIS